MTVYRNEKGATLVIPDGASAEIAAAQTAIAEAQGMKEVVDAGTKPAPSPFARYVERIVPEYSDEGDLVRWRRTWKELPMPIHLSQAKVLAHPVVSAKIESMIPALSSDARLVNWWTSSMTYVRGSEMAVLAMESLGLTEAEIEQIALECRA